MYILFCLLAYPYADMSSFLRNACSEGRLEKGKAKKPLIEIIRGFSI
jgi:hypothetical protein